MNIIDTNNIRFADQLTELLCKKFGDRNSMSVWLKYNLGTDFMGVWSAVEGDEAVGLLLAQIPVGQAEVGFIEFLISKPEKTMEIHKELLGIFAQWAKSKGLKKVIYYAPKRKIAEQFGFKFITSVMAKEINNGTV